MPDVGKRSSAPEQANAAGVACLTILSVKNMSEKVGEIARESADYHCEHCRNVTRISQGELIGPCPYCGNDAYDLRDPNEVGVDVDPASSASP